MIHRTRGVSFMNNCPQFISPFGRSCRLPTRPSGTSGGRQLPYFPGSSTSSGMRRIKMVQAMARWEPLSVDIKVQTIYCAGPSFAKPGQMIDATGPIAAVACTDAPP